MKREAVLAILLESPEAFPWQRIWQWVQLTPANFLSRGLQQVDVVWTTDGTRGLIVPLGGPRGRYNLSIAFQGNLGAEAPCITQSGYPVSETVALGSLILGPQLRRGR